MKKARKQIYKKCLIVLICLLIVGNSAHGVVLCFGVGGHIEIESAFHQPCDDPAHSQPTEKNQLLYHSDHVKDRHCEPCVDIPISIGLVKISRASKQLNSAFSAPAKNMTVPTETFNLSAYNLASSAFEAASYFTPLRAVILQI
ncbi:MAG: hypothetical protein ACYTBP_13295 [Planctomycetota bacterium]